MVFREIKRHLEAARVELDDVLDDRGSAGWWERRGRGREPIR